MKRLYVSLLAMGLASSLAFAQDVPDPNLQRGSTPTNNRNGTSAYANPRVITPSRLARAERYEYYTFDPAIANQPTETLPQPAAAEQDRNLPGRAGMTRYDYRPPDFNARDYNYATGHWFDSWYGR